jgi:prevent-host-death family protein
MKTQALLAEPGRVDEPRAADDYAAVLSQVAAEQRPVIVRRNGEDLAVIISLEHLEILREALARHEVEQQAQHLKQPGQRPPQWWFEDTDNPFEPD